MQSSPMGAIYSGVTPLPEEEIPIALQPGSLIAKSKVYIGRALARKSGGDLDEYQLWASLALELLGKSVLSSKHPCLIVDPNHYQSLFASAGIVISTDVKTIAAHTLFERLRHLSPKFDDRAKTFAVGIAQRRNAELHSGDVPFRTMKLDAWEAQYWHGCSILLAISGSNLDEWLGADNAKAPNEVVEHAIRARKDAARVRLKNSAEDFNALKKSERETALFDASRKSAFHYSDLFTFLADAEWPVACPSCTGKAYLAGLQTGEEIKLDGDGESEAWETVEKTYSPEEFHCPVCGLQLQGFDELEIADLESEHIEEEEREMDYEPDYGND